MKTETMDGVNSSNIEIEANVILTISDDTARAMLSLLEMYCRDNDCHIEEFMNEGELTLKFNKEAQLKNETH